LIILELRIKEVVVTTGATRQAKLHKPGLIVLQAGSPSCLRSNAVESLKGKVAHCKLTWGTSNPVFDH